MPLSTTHGPNVMSPTLNPGRAWSCRLERAVADDVSLLALTIDERAVILAALEGTTTGRARTHYRRTGGGIRRGAASASVLGPGACFAPGP